MSTQQKSILAKLLATENISVQHRNSMTAYFDPKNRVMVLPVWKDMSDNLHDLLLGHETGHALYTPPDGWHDSVKDSSRRGFKTYLNVVEDIRIEKLIQKKYPGLKACFTKGYSDLMERDFFGVKELDIQSLPFIDRINLHFKVGSYLNIQFTDKEQAIIDRLDKVFSWDEVVKMATELYNARKDELSKFEQLMQDFEFDEDLNEYEDDWDDDLDAEDDDSTENGNEGKRKKYENFDGEADDPESITDRNFRRREKELIDDSVKPYHYVDCPKANLRNIIVPYKNLKFNYNNFRYPVEMYRDDEAANIIENGKTVLMKKFLDTNKKYISYLVKEFEMRRNARQFARASISKTGQLDIKKAYSYRINEDLFKRMTVVPNGKSHGLVMFIDYSGSMTDNIVATVEQTLILATFCRKVNIPFRVYAFTDLVVSAETAAKELGYNDVLEYEQYLSSYYSYSRKHILHEKYAKFSVNNNELHLTSSHFKLREYLSSEMTGIEFKNAAKYWLLVANLMQNTSYSFRKVENKIPNDLYHFRNSSYESLNGTPLNEAVISSIDIVKEFKEQYRLDVVNTVFLTDGDGNESPDKVDDGAIRRIAPYGERDINIVVRDAETNLTGKSSPRTPITIALLRLLKAKTKSNVIGFFLIGTYSPKRAIQKKADDSGYTIINLDETLKNFRKNKFFMLNDVGYDDYYIIPGGDELRIEEDVLDVNDGASKSEIKRAFLKMQKGKIVNRVLLNRFVEKIS